MSELFNKRKNKFENDIFESKDNKIPTKNNVDVSKNSQCDLIQNLSTDSLESDEPDTERDAINPGDPTLAKFQKALKEYLLSQINDHKLDIVEIDHEIKQKNSDLEKLANKTYDIQQIGAQQQIELENLTNKIKHVKTEIKIEEDSLLANKYQLKEIDHKNFQIEKNTIELNGNIETLYYWNKELANKDDLLKANATTAKQAAEIITKQTSKLDEDKAKQDFVIHKLTAENSKLKNELNLMDEEINTKDKRLNELRKIMNANDTKIVEIQTEQKCLVNSWENVIVKLGYRDKQLVFVTGEVQKRQKINSCLENQIENKKDLVIREIKQNERLKSVLNKQNEEIKKYRIEIADKAILKADMENDKLENEAFFNEISTETDLVAERVKESELVMKQISKNCDELFMAKHKFDEEIVKTMQDKITNNGFLKTIISKLDVSRYKRKEIEIKVEIMKQRRADIETFISRQRYKNDELTLCLKDNEDQLRENRQELKNTEKQRNTMNLELKNAQSKRDRLVKELDRIAEDTKKETIDINENIENLETELNQMQQITMQLKVTWLSVQSNLITLTNQHQTQVNKINSFKRKILLLDQKNIRDKIELEELINKSEKFKCSIMNLTKQYQYLCEKIVTKKHQKLGIDKNLSFVKHLTDINLKEAELDLLRFEDNVATTELEKQSLIEELTEINREVVDLEKTVGQVKQALEEYKEDLKPEGSMYELICRNRKLKLIYKKLMDKHKKLLKKMEGSISRRNYLNFMSKVKESVNSRNSKTSGPYSKTNIRVKAASIRRQIKDATNEINSLKGKYKDMDSKASEITRIILNSNLKREAHNCLINDLKEKIKSAKIDNEFKFQLLVLRQQKVKLYAQISRGKSPYTMFKTEEKLASGYQLQVGINKRLLYITEKLKEHFSSKNFELCKLCNCLQVVFFASNQKMLL